MTSLLVDERDIKFVLYEQLNIETLCETERYSEFSREMFDMVLDASQKLAENELLPANSDGDTQGVKLENGQVTVPESFHQAYRHYREGGWISLTVDPEAGGQGFPLSLYSPTNEFFIAANMALMCYPGLGLGAGRLIERYGTEEQRQTFLEKIYTGEWGGTMCLTEPQAGSDVAALRTKAFRNPDGTYSIVGNKIFITSGDHDLTENIVHMVLARVERAPRGTKGISIFIVPKKRVENGAPAPNDVTTMAAEKKIGIHGSATCALNFGENGACVGYLLGEEKKGMRIMFEMMNGARHFVALQALAVAGTAYMHALKYARDRIQGPDISAMRDPAAPKVPIIHHPDVRRMLMWMKSVTEGIRALVYYINYCEDVIMTAQSDEEVAKYQAFVDLLIPICKAWCSDQAFRVAETAIQVHGGYGICRDYPVEQFLRDLKITSVYEGTNGIQALDLVGRKLAQKQGALFTTTVAETEGVVNLARDNPRLAGIAEAFEAARSQLVEVTQYFGVTAASGDFKIPVLYATPYLDLFGDVAVGFMLLWQAVIADRKLQEIFANAKAETDESKAEVFAANRDAAFYRGKIASAEFFSNTFLSLSKGKAQAMMSGERSALDLPEQSFALL